MKIMKNFRLIYILGILPIAIILTIIGVNFDIGWIVRIANILFYTFGVLFLLFAIFGFINFLKK